MQPQSQPLPESNWYWVNGAIPHPVTVGTGLFKPSNPDDYCCGENDHQNYAAIDSVFRLNDKEDAQRDFFCEFGMSIGIHTGVWYFS